MSADSTELTFIRCSSCRSLVPAMSTRCRMCGADLQAKKTAVDVDDQIPKEKVEAKAPVIAPPLEIDPLNEFLSSDEAYDDVDVADDLPEEFLAEESSNIHEDLVDEFEDDFDEEQAIKELDSLLEELNAASVVSEAPIVEAQPIKETKKVEAPKMVEKVLEIPIPSIVKKEITPKEAIAPIVKESVELEAPVVTKSLNNKFQPKVSNRVEVKEEKIMEKDHKVSENKLTAIKSASVKQSTKQTPLFGWFVNYQEAEGVSREIREGKFFVTGKSLKPNDLIIEDDTVSTPHAMITVSHELGFQIQDLMSEQGLYLKKYGTKKYEVVDDIEVIENGDWVRFGNIEFMVVIMPA